MRLALNLNYSGASVALDIDKILEAERLGYSSVWTAEAYGSDAVTPLAWIAARTKQIHVASGIMQMPARTPAMTAMTAATLDALSGGRFICGIGLSGPQVVEGWHGVPYGKPLVKTREYIEILRAIWAREKPLEFSGEHYQIPYAGAGATGLGKPLKSILHPRPDIPIVIAAIGPKNIALSAEIADGVLPAFFNPYKAAEVFGEPIKDGQTRRSSDLRPASEFDVICGCMVMVTDDVPAALNFVKPGLALYIGGMGARGRNFYNDLACRYGFEAAAKEIQDLYLDGKKKEAMAAVPDELADATCLVGSPERIRDRFEVWKESPATVMLLGGRDRKTFEMMLELGA